ncbi:MAG: hypothetical protein ING70_00005 [Rhodocyclaceae bacterium]|nr:hypothetical protein [Rhodocyclaceae bacterium]
MRAPSSTPTWRPSTSTRPPAPALPVADTVPATWAVSPACSRMRPPASPSALTLAPGATSRVREALKMISPPAPTCAPVACTAPCWRMAAA